MWTAIQSNILRSVKELFDFAQDVNRKFRFSLRLSSSFLDSWIKRNQFIRFYSTNESSRLRILDCKLSILQNLSNQSSFH